MKKRTREEILLESFEFYSQKTNQRQRMKLTEDCRKMVLNCENLFVNFPTEQNINLKLKQIATICKIDKIITTHVARHTFATTFIRNKGDIYRLQKLLGHSNIRHTIKYVHLVNSEILDDIELVKY